MWRPWTLGVVTERWAQAVDAMSLACLVGILGNVLLLMFPSRSLRSFIACAVAAANLAGAAAVYAVFPFDFGVLGLGWFDPVMHVVLLVALIGAAIGLAFRWRACSLDLPWSVEDDPGAGHLGSASHRRRARRRRGPVDFMTAGQLEARRTGLRLSRSAKCRDSGRSPQSPARGVAPRHHLPVIRHAERRGAAAIPR
ncbi:hypothetical protein OV079_27415 [Nannocystis pusilla]|uniref:Uncharacterized protein n=1 Tax=Nannocystis pusilla TaxID=889268 RepID=A0A9X3ERY3_9BACT|nr:hypothetical protein [Nannocystis pusilla]MCY1009229.1 hypothetical protein [Nannocystis pusilla]